MPKHVVVFIGWGLAGLSFVVALAGLSTPGAGKLISLAFFGWALLFLPPLWNKTIKYGLTANILSRLVALIVFPVFFACIAIANGYKGAEVSTATIQPTTSSIIVSPSPSKIESPRPSKESVIPQPSAGSLAASPNSIKVESSKPAPESIKSTPKETQPEDSPNPESLSIDELMKSRQANDDKTTYTTSEDIEDSSTGTAKRFSRRIIIPLGRTREEVRETLEKAMRDLLGQRNADAAIIWGYSPNNSLDSSYDVGMATFAPDGVWSKASSGEAKRVIIEFTASYFK